YQQQIRSLEEKTSDLQQATQQLDQLSQENQRLQTENQLLQSRCQTDISSLQGIESHLAQLRAGNEALEQKVRAEEGRTQIFEQEAQRLRSQIENQEREISQKIQHLEKERTVLQTRAEQAGNVSAHETEDLKKVNQQLAEQSKLVQAELVKARARAQGLERICADYQAQLEEMIKKPQSGMVNP
ncbi:MAG TPA: hypothetical protein PLO93_07405, partial [Candidatus Omnitrophota bacterium]|nr:hypothetical protein [Candidatus Omnitrophota bacterium]